MITQVEATSVWWPDLSQGGSSIAVGMVRPQGSGGGLGLRDLTSVSIWRTMIGMARLPSRPTFKFWEGSRTPPPPSVYIRASSPAKNPGPGGYPGARLILRLSCKDQPGLDNCLQGKDVCTQYFPDATQRRCQQQPNERTNERKKRKKERKNQCMKESSRCWYRGCVRCEKVNE